MLRAARSGDLPAAQQLLAEGADPNGPGDDEKLDRSFREICGYGSPLEIAAEAGHIEIVKLLLQSGARRRYYEQDTFAALHGGHVEIVRVFLEAGVEPNSSTKHGEALLDAAAHMGHVPLVHLLLEHSADVDGGWSNEELDEMDDVETPLAIAVRCGHSEVVEVLLAAGANLRGKSADDFRQEAREVIARKAQLKLQDALWLAAYEGDKNAVQQWIEAGADAKDVNSYGNTALHSAINRGGESYDYEKRPLFTEIVRFLVPISDTTQKNSDGKTAFQLAAKLNYGEALQELLPMETKLSTQEKLQWNLKIRQWLAKAQREMEKDRHETEAFMKELEWMQNNPELLKQIFDSDAALGEAEKEALIQELERKLGISE